MECSSVYIGEGSMLKGIKQNKGKESENSYQKLREITVGQAHKNTRKLK